jgi:8-oxo-dGTP diphosphatase
MVEELEEQPLQEDDLIERLSWIFIRNRRVLFVRKKGGDVFFDPGCRREGNQDDALTLSKKIKEDFDIDLALPLELMTSFAAPAYGKQGEAMVEIRCYLANYSGVFTIADHIAETDWFIGSDMHRTSDAGKHILEWLSQHGLIYAR